MATLCLDISKTGTGWARRDASTYALLSGSKAFGGDNHGATMQEFKLWMQAQLVGVTRIVIERPWQSAKFPQPILTKLVGVAEMVAHAYGLPAELTSPKTIKKAITGDGNADKSAMMVAISKMIGRPITDDNQADAIGILLAAEAGALHAAKKPARKRAKKCTTGGKQTARPSRKTAALALPARAPRAKPRAL